MSWGSGIPQGLLLMAHMYIKGKSVHGRTNPSVPIIGPGGDGTRMEGSLKKGNGRDTAGRVCGALEDNGG